MGALSYDPIYMSKPINHTYARIKPTLLCDPPLPHDSDTLKQKPLKIICRCSIQLSFYFLANTEKD